jgi:type I restriction enzyme S subunit
MSESVRFGQLFAVPLRNGVSYTTEQRGSGIPMVNMREIFAYDRISDQECELAPLTAREQESSLLADGDLLFARQSLTYEGAGKCVLVLPSETARTWESHLIRVRLDRQLASPDYYFYYFRSAQGRQSIETIIQQVAAAGIRGSDLARLQVPSVPLDEQWAVAEVLGALDDKIAVNTALARVADEWVRAGFDALSREAADVRTIGELVSIRRDQVSPDSLAAETQYVGLEHVPRRRMWLGEVGSAADVTSNKSRFEQGDILFGKLRPYFHKVVSVSYRGVCSTDIVVLPPIDPALSGFALAAVASDSVVRDVTSASEGTRMPRTNWKDLASVQVPWPGLTAAKSFSVAVSAVRESVESRLTENRTLAATRDALLPQLMSGKLRVRDAEKILEGVL